MKQLIIGLLGCGGLLDRRTAGLQLQVQHPDIPRTGGDRLRLR